MKEKSLYNGKLFPEYIYDNNLLSCIFLEFDFIFTEEFWIIFRQYLDQNRIIKITIENIQPKDFPFYDEVYVNDLPQSFIDSTCERKMQNYINGSASFYMLTENAMIYSKENKNLFCLFLDRQYDLAILGLSNRNDIDPFNDFIIKDINDYLTIAFKGNEIPQKFKERLNANWKL